ncbi:hybrid sensor histidine kinase/response regulator [Caulobacter sp. CCUG 60055]|uniref:ATP-binding protein n=1 Tax=Caulobacter sp. CCUG 60055 TaxID=2100090 RepID=UPI001FA7CD5B|nr:ATP-binding protein [Caulobacter sp. CCUG 60055]MCI3180614.1 hybrid sensor histidine kinase/response regulator [Caulobacter sp. CCUG 60055]
MNSLARRFLLSVGVMTVAVSVLASVAAFLTFQRELERRQVGYLSDYVAERSNKEDRRFSDLTGLHQAASEALKVRVRAMSQPEADRLFDLYFPLQKDGTRRTRPQSFDGGRDAAGDYVYGIGGFISDGRRVPPLERRALVAAYQVVSHFGEGFRPQYDNFYFYTPHTRLVMFGPDRPDRLMFYRHDAPADLDIGQEEMVHILNPRANPARTTRCTSLQRLVQDKTGERLATACVTPVDIDGALVGGFGSSIQLTGYFMRAVGDATPGTSNLIVSNHGDLIAYPGFARPGVASPGTVAAYERSLRLKSLIETIRADGKHHGVVVSPDGKQIVAYGFLTGPDWYFLIASPKSAIMVSALRSAAWILMIGLLAALAQSALIVAVARGTIIRPLSRLAASTEAARIGGRGVEDLEARADEVGALARALRTERERADEVLASLEQRVRERTAQLEAANHEKSRFLANMSHELRTPLNGVVAVSETLAREQKTKRTRELAELIVSSGRLLEQVLTDILDFSKIEAGRMGLEISEFQPQALSARIAALHRAAAEAKGLTLRWSVDVSAFGVYRGDPVRITQILSNLLSNAVKFTEAGEVDMTIAATPEGLCFTVRDTGIGFDDAAGVRLFERFEQADASITRRFGGTGLGLAICRSLTELMGGTIAVESEPRKGSTFTLRLPLERVGGVVAKAAPEAPPAEPPAEGVRVLLAEDHPTNQKVVRLILEAAGLDLTVVDNGAQALDALADQPFDVVLMDMQMPEMDGLTATIKLRIRECVEGAPPVPVIMLTANALDEHVKASLEAGADLHLSKPVRPDALLAAIGQALALRQAKVEAAA